MQDQIANLLSGMTKSPETLSVLPPHKDNTGNTENKRNAEKNGHTDNTDHADNMKHTKLNHTQLKLVKRIILILYILAM